MPPAARLRRRTPSGKIAYPLVMVEGEEKAGKTVEMLALAASPRIGEMFAFDLGEGRLDEYGSLAPYTIVETNGTWSDFIGQLRLAAAEPQEDENRPNVLAIDTGTALWKGMLVPWVDSRARSSRKNRERLAEDPDAEIDASMNLWNDAKDRWREFVDVLRDFPGIAIVTARGRAVTAVDADGRPIPRTTEWSVEVEKSFPYDVTASVRLKREPRRAELRTAVSLAFNYEAEGKPRELPLTEIKDLHAVPGSGVLHHLIFDLMRCGELATTDTPQITRPSVGITERQAKNRLFNAIKGENGSLSDDELRAETLRLWADQGLEGKGEVTAEELADALTAVDKVADPPAEKSEPEPPAEPEDSESPPPAPEPPAEPEAHGTITVAQTFLDRLDDEKGRGLREMAEDLGVAKGGSVPELRERLRAKLHEMVGQVEPDGPPSEPDVDEVPLPQTPEEDAEAEAMAIPDNAIFSSCVCGMDIWRLPNRKTFRHVDPALDDAHEAEESF